MLLLIYTKTVIFLPYKKYIYIYTKNFTYKYIYIYIYFLQWLKYLLIIIEIILISLWLIDDTVANNINLIILLQFWL